MSEQTEEEYLIERLSKLLAEISVIVNGPQPMGVLWSYADLPQKVQALKDSAPQPQPQASAEDVEWRWVDDAGRAMTSWRIGDLPPEPLREISDERGVMRVQTRVTAAPQPQAASPDFVRYEVGIDVAEGIVTATAVGLSADGVFHVLAYAQQPQAAPADLEARIVQMAEEYELRGDEGDYTPNEHERFMLLDFAHEVAEALATPQPQPVASAEDIAKVESCIENHVDVIDAREEWQNIRASLGVGRG